jgi:hypothetical protein
MGVLFREKTWDIVSEIIDSQVNDDDDRMTPELARGSKW